MARSPQPCDFRAEITGDRGDVFFSTTGFSEERTGYYGKEFFKIMAI